MQGLTHPWSRGVKQHIVTLYIEVKFGLININKSIDTSMSRFYLEVKGFQKFLNVVYSSLVGLGLPLLA